MSETKQNQKLIENKLANFTEEIAHHNSNLNVKIQELQKDFDQLKTITERVNASSGNSHCFLSNSNFSSKSGSNLSLDSHNNTGASNSGFNAYSNSLDPNHQNGNQNKTGAYNTNSYSRFNSFDTDPPQIGNSFDMHGETSKSIILEGSGNKRMECSEK